MKKNQLFALALAAALSLSLAACGTTNSDSAQEPADTTNTAPISPAPTEDGTTESENVQIPNPWQDASTLEEAEELAGFSITVPERISGYGTRTFQVLTGDEATLEAYYAADEGDGRVYIRKASGADDISGDYNTYSQTETVTAESGREVTVQGNDDVYHLATWTEDGYTYCVGVSDGLSSADLVALAMEVQ